MKFNFKKKKLEIRRSVYKNNQMALIIIDPKTDEQKFTLTTSVTGYDFPKDQLAIATWGENKALAEVVFNTGLFEDTGFRATSEDNISIIEFWRFIVPKNIDLIPPIT